MFKLSMLASVVAVFFRNSPYVEIASEVGFMFRLDPAHSFQTCNCET